MENAAIVIVYALAAYALAGAAFAIPFVLFGVQQLDAAAEGTGPGFRLLILPGCIALWPLLLRRWARVNREERT